METRRVKIDILMKLQRCLPSLLERCQMNFRINHFSLILTFLFICSLFVPPPNTECMPKHSEAPEDTMPECGNEKSANATENLVVE